MSLRAAVYCRISRDRSGLGAGVERQLADCRELAERRNFTIVTELTDNDVSAYSGKARPGYRRLLELLTDGAIDVVLAWHPDRLHRSPVELEEFITVLERRGVGVETVQAGIWDLSTPSGRLIARQLGGVARYESEHRSVRVKRALEENASRGQSHGRRPYGWVRDRDPETGLLIERIEPQEAEVVRLIAAQICDGESLRSIADGLNSSGVKSPSGTAWKKNLVRHVVLRPRNVGRHRHRGQIIGQGAWDPILEEEIYARVLSILQDPARRTSYSSSVRHLLSGIAKCGVCGGLVRVSQNRGRPSYRCRDSGCVSRSQQHVDEFVVAVVVERLSRPDARAILDDNSRGSVEKILSSADAKRAALDGAADAFAAGSIDQRQLERISLTLRRELASLEDDAARLLAQEASIGFSATEPLVSWSNLPLARRRALVSVLCEVTIDKTEPGERTFDPRRIRIAWRSHDD